MRVGMHEMHALRVRGFFHDNDSDSLRLALLMRLDIHPTWSGGS